MINKKINVQNALFLMKNISYFSYVLYDLM